MNNDTDAFPKEHETHEQWRARRFGHRGSIREAIARAELDLSMAGIKRDCAKRIADAGTWVNYGTTWKHLQRAITSERKEMRKNARESIWWALVAQVRLATGAPLS